MAKTVNKKIMWGNLEVILLFVVGMIIGWSSNSVYEHWNYQKVLDGLRLSNYNYSEAEKIAYDLDKLGDWVLVNVKDMNYERAYEVCIHECSHQAYSEIFAEQCEKNLTKCIEKLR